MHTCKHIQMHVCIHIYTCVHINEHVQSGEGLTSRIYSKLPHSNDKITNPTRNLLLAGTILTVCFDFFLCRVRATWTHLPPVCPSVAEVAVGPVLGHCNCLWGIHMCLQKPSDTLKLREPDWDFTGPCGLEQATAVHLPVWKWGGQATDVSDPFCSDPSVTPRLGIPPSCTMTGWRWGFLPINHFHFRTVHPAHSNTLLNSVPRINLCLDSELHDLIITTK